MTLSLHLIYHKKQSGFVLVTSLMLLMIITLTSITSMRTTILEEKMAGNSRDLALAFQAAETAIKDAEHYIETILVSPSAAFDGNTAGLHAQNSHPDIYADSTWLTAATYSSTFNHVASQPRYIIEISASIATEASDINIHGYGESPGPTLTTYRITARGTGGTDNAVILLQSNYAREF